MRRKIQHIFLGVFVITMLSACVNVQGGAPLSMETNSISPNNGCLLAQPVFSYDEIGSLPHGILPTSPWTTVSSLPPEIDGGDIVFGYQATGGQEIWIRSRKHSFVEVYDPFYKQSFEEYWVYNINNDNWRSVSSTTSDGKAVAYTLFFDDQRNILLAGNIPNSNETAATLSVYDAKKEIFVPITNTENLFENQIDKVYGSSYLMLPATDESNSEDLIWFLVQHDGIYSYDLNTNELRKRLDFKKSSIIQNTYLGNEMIKYGYVGKNNLIYFTVYDATRTYSPPTIQDFPLFVYNSQINEVAPISPPLDPYPIFSNYLVDSAGNLWLDSLGWRDSALRWHKIVQPSIFISQNNEGYFSTDLAVPKILLESGDGRIWFHHANGMISLDPKKGEWCWFTTYQSNIVEDSEQNLWMIADGKLYKLSLNP